MYRVVRRGRGVQLPLGLIAVLFLTALFACRPSAPRKEPASDVAPPEQTVGDEQPAAEPTEKEPPPPPDEQPAGEPTEPTETTEQPEPAEQVDPVLEPAVKHMPRPVANPAAEAKTEEQMKPYTEKITGTDATFEMVPIPGGLFEMGSPPEEPGHKEDEAPQVEVKIEPFWMGRHEVTWNEYELWAMGLDKQRRDARRPKSPSTPWDKTADALAIPTKPYSDMTFGMGKEGYPAICMTQFAAKVYCKWLTAKTGRYYRLPTEAEWEYACRAGTATPYSFGRDPEKLDDYAWYTENSEEQYHKVGRKKPNPWGLFDMHGNVCEWCLDEYVADRYEKLAEKAGDKPLENPFTIVTKMYPQVVRGGAWTDEPEKLRSAARRASNPDWRAQDPQIPQSIWYHTDADFVGFRVVRPLHVPPPEEAERYEVTEFEKEEYLDYMEFQAGKM